MGIFAHLAPEEDAALREELCWLDEFLVEGAILGDPSGELWVGWGPLEQTSEATPGTPAFYAPDFFLKTDTPWLCPRGAARVRCEDLRAALAPLARRPAFSCWERCTRGEFSSAFEEVQAAIDRGCLAKAVPAFFDATHCQLGAAERAALLGTILERTNGHAYLVYGFWSSEGGMMGASPEILFTRGADGVLHTAALAGTQPCSASAQLLDCSKNRWEHQLVVDGIVEALSPMGSVMVGDTATLILPTLAHLRTPITVLPRRPGSMAEIVHSMHPTPALGGSPRDDAWKWLARREHACQRGRFGAPFGLEQGDGEAVCVVAIRGVEWSSTQLRMGAGCGLVAQSDVDLEWEELQLKLACIRQSVGL